MAKICPKCSADTETLEEETQKFCIHEKIGITLVGATVVVIGLLGAGII